MLRSSFKAVVLGVLLSVILSLDARAEAIIIDHNCTDLSEIGLDWVNQAAAIDVVLRHASVGGNINSGLNDIQAADSTYDRSNWIFSGRGNPGWQAKVDDLVTYTAAHLSQYQVFSMKFCYIDTSATFAYYRDKMEYLETTYPQKTFVWWTMPIKTTGLDAYEAFNGAVRNYCEANEKVLFDIADIESHDPDGNALTDGQGREIMYSGYTYDGGHLNELGRQKVARGYWHLVARIAGFVPEPPPPPEPHIESAVSYSATELAVTFDRDVAPVSAERSGNYQLVPTVAIYSAVLVDPNRVKLETDPLAPGATYTVTVSDVNDPNGTDLGQMEVEFTADFPCPIMTDLTCDGAVDIYDVRELGEKWLFADFDYLPEDIFPDGRVDFLDFAMLANDYHQY